MKNINHRDIFGGLFREGFETQHWPDGNQGDLLVCTGEQWIPSNLNGAGVAPNTASFVTVNNEASLTSERRLDADYGFTIVDNGAGSNVVVTPPVPGPDNNLMVAQNNVWVSQSPFVIDSAADSMGYTKIESRDNLFAELDMTLDDYVHWDETPVYSNISGQWPHVSYGPGIYQPLHTPYPPAPAAGWPYFRFEDGSEQFWLVSINLSYGNIYCDEGMVRLRAFLAYDTDWNTGDKFITEICLNAGLPVTGDDDDGIIRISTVNFNFPIHITTDHTNWSLSFKLMLDGPDWTLGDGDGVPQGDFRLVSAYYTGGGSGSLLDHRRCPTDVTFLQLKQQVNGSSLNDASVVVLSTHPNLTNERVLQGSLGFTFTDGGANNNVTLTPPTPGTSGNILTSNGTNWVSGSAYSGTTNEIEVTGTVIGLPDQVVFNVNAPKCAISPAAFDSLINLQYLQNLMLSAYGQSDVITSVLNSKYTNTRNIWYNKLAVASANSFWINNGETVEALEIAITTKSTMPQWPVYLSLFSGTFTSAQDIGCFMLPPPGSTKSYTRLMTQTFGARTTAAGTYTSLWDNTTTNVLGAPTSVLAADGGAGTQWGLTWGVVVGSGTTQIIENFDTITTGSFANINILTSPSSSEYFSAIQIRGRY